MLAEPCPSPAWNSTVAATCSLGTASTSPMSQLCCTALHRPGLGSGPLHVLFCALVWRLDSAFWSLPQGQARAQHCSGSWLTLQPTPAHPCSRRGADTPDHTLWGWSHQPQDLGITQQPVVGSLTQVWVRHLGHGAAASFIHRGPVARTQGSVVGQLLFHGALGYELTHRVLEACPPRKRATFACSDALLQPNALAHSDSSIQLLHHLRRTLSK